MKRLLNKTLKMVEQQGILLESDSDYLSVVTIVAGGPVKGSWWGHPKGNEIYHLLQELCNHHDLLRAKFVKGKVTYIHRSHWPEFLTVAKSDSAWQTSRLSKEAKKLLKTVKSNKTINTHDKKIRALAGSKKIGLIVSELEKKLLVNSMEIHTDSGAHAKILQTWDEWGKNAKIRKKPISYEKAVIHFERLNTSIKWPWM